MVLLLGVGWLIDVRATVQLFQGTDWRWVVVGLAIVQIQVVLSAVRWQVTAVRLGHTLSVVHAVREYYLATLMNLSMPGGITGDAARIYRNRRSQGHGTMAHSVMLERLAGQIALFVVTLTGWLLWPILIRQDVPGLGKDLLSITVVIAIVIGIIIWVTIRQNVGPVARFLAGFGPAIKQAWLLDHQWLVQGVLSILILCTYLAVFACAATALQQPLPLVAMITVVPMVLLSMLIPLSIGGWGVREAAALSLWPLAGLSGEVGVATSMLYGAVSLLGCAPGLLLTRSTVAQVR